MSQSSHIRIELFFKNKPELEARIQWLGQRNVSKYNLVNKGNKDELLDWSNTIRDIQPEADTSIHYSLKYNKFPRAKDPNQHYHKFKSFLQKVPSNQEILLVLGSSKTQSWDSVVALQKLQADNIVRQFAVAYNPFFPDAKNRQEEDERLNQKVKTGRVSKIYLQFGTDLLRLQEALQDLSDYDIPLAASVFLPTRMLIAQQNFRSWKGVYLSDEFLAGPEQAREIVVRMLRIYKQNNVELLIEAPGVRLDKDTELVEALLQDRDGDDNCPERTKEAEKGEKDKQTSNQPSLNNSYKREKWGHSNTQR